MLQVKMLRPLDLGARGGFWIGLVAALASLGGVLEGPGLDLDLACAFLLPMHCWAKQCPFCRARRWRVHLSFLVWLAAAAAVALGSGSGVRWKHKLCLWWRFQSCHQSKSRATGVLASGMGSGNTGCGWWGGCRATIHQTPTL